MPTYESRCNICGEFHEYIKSVANYLDTPDCCGEKTQKLISAPMFTIEVEMKRYTSPVNGNLITTRKERTEDLKKTGSRPYEGLEQEKKEAARHHAYQDAKDTLAMQESVAKTISNLSTDKKRRLAKEMNHGIY